MTSGQVRSGLAGCCLALQTREAWLGMGSTPLRVLQILRFPGRTEVRRSYWFFYFSSSYLPLTLFYCYSEAMSLRPALAPGILDRRASTPPYLAQNCVTLFCDIRQRSVTSLRAADCLGELPLRLASAPIQDTLCHPKKHKQADLESPADGKAPICAWSGQGSGAPCLFLFCGVPCCSSFAACFSMRKPRQRMY